jgi:hypothetical protein
VSYEGLGRKPRDLEESHRSITEKPLDRKDITETEGGNYKRKYAREDKTA